MLTPPPFLDATPLPTTRYRPEGLDAVSHWLAAVGFYSVATGERIGKNRHDWNRKRRSSAKRGQETQTVEARQSNDRIGAIGEVAVSEVFELPLPSDTGQTPRGDVADIEVRSIDGRARNAKGQPRGGRLILHEDSHADRRYLFVIVTMAPDGRALCDLCGWRMGGDWRQHPGWWREYREGGGAYYVPNADLYPMSTWNGGPVLGSIP